MGITAKLNIDEVLSGLDDLIDRLSQIPDSAATQIEVTGMDDVEAAASEAEVSLEQVGEAAGMVGTDLSSIDTSSLESVSESASTAADDITSVGTSASDIDLSLQSIGEAASFAGNGIGGISEKMQQTKEETKEASDATSMLAEGFGLVEGAVGALVAIGVSQWISDISNAAGNFQDSWLRLTLSMNGTTEEVGVMKDQWNGAITEMHDTTGRRAGAIREFITQMGISGVQSSDVIVQAFDAIAASDFILNGGKNLDSVASAFENVIRQPTRVVGALRTMGITTDDILKSTGLSTQELTEKFKGMSVEQRAVFLANILNAKYGQEANEGYKLSWEHVKEALGAAWDYMSRILGSLILPLVVPVLEFLTNLLSSVASAIDDLSPVLKNIAGFIILVAGALVSFAGLWSGVSALLSGITPILGALGIETVGLGGALGTLAGVLSGPVGWAILAIIAIIGTAIYIWQNWSNEIIKLKDALTSGDWGTAANMIVGAFTYVGQAIYNAFVYAGQQIWAFITDLPRRIGEGATNWINIGQNFITWLIYGLQSLSDYLTGILFDMLTRMSTDGSAGEAGQSTGEETGKGLIEGFNQWVLDNAQLIYDTLNLLFNTLMPLIGQLILQLAAIIALWMIQTGQKAATDFVNAFIQYLMQLPGRLLATLTLTVLTIFSWAGQLVMLAWQTGSSFVNTFILFLSQLPGRAWAIFLQFLAYLGSLPGRAYSYAVSTGSSIVSGIGAYLQSLPGRMYTWGMQALQRFVDGIINSIPGLRAALDAVSSLFPHSPPKEGPLATITESNMYNWMKDIIDAGVMAANEFDLESIILPKNITGGVSSTNNKTMVSNITVKHEHVFDLKNVPSTMDEKTLIDAFKYIIKSREGKSYLDEAFGELYGEYKRSTGG